MRKLLSLLALALTVASLSGAPAFGAANGTDRPLNGSGSGTGVIMLTGGIPTSSVIDGTTIQSHLGLSTFHTVNVITGPTTADVTTTYFAANGDTVTFSGTSTSVFTSPTTLTFTAPFTVTGGTGRFAGASGAGTVTGTASLNSPLTFDLSFTLTGTISY
jgi:hypothetical protein